MHWEPSLKYPNPFQTISAVLHLSYHACSSISLLKFHPGCWKHFLHIENKLSGNDLFRWGTWGNQTCSFTSEAIMTTECLSGSWTKFPEPHKSFDTSKENIWGSELGCSTSRSRQTHLEIMWCAKCWCRRQNSGVNRWERSYMLRSPWTDIMIWDVFSKSLTLLLPQFPPFPEH